MHKKYISNQDYRHLVMPMMITGLEASRTESIRLNSNSISENKKKKCC